MHKVLLAVLLACLLIGPALAENPVQFADTGLKAAVEDALWVFDPTPTDMLGLIELDIPNTDWDYARIENITGLEYATHLQSLNLRNHQVSDLSPLAGLINLETLILHSNRSITDISPLAGLTHLRELDLEKNEISDISVLSGLTNLSWIGLHRNQVSDISPLTALTSLTFLDLRINALNEEAYETHIQQIFDNNPGIYFVYDPTYFRYVWIESTRGGSIVSPGEGEFVYEYGESFWLEAEADPGFAFVHFSGTYCHSQNPVLWAVIQDQQILAKFVSVLEKIYVDSHAASDPMPGDASASDPQENGTAAHPFDSIQEAIEVASEGASIVVRPGTYCENIDLLGKSVQLMGGDPNDPNATAYPVIDGTYRQPVVSFTSGEDPNCTLTGFIITRGRGESAGAIACSGSSPTIANCVIVGNLSTDPDGAAVYCADSNAVFINCTIADNYGGQQDTALRVVDSNVAVSNSILWGNTASAIFTKDESTLSLTYTDIAGGWAGTGNMQSNPLFAQHGYWVDAVSGLPTEPNDLNAIWVAGDYHLKSQTGRWDPKTESWFQDDVTSPCIDSGDPLHPIGREPSPNGGIINMGAYGGTIEASLGG